MPKKKKGSGGASKKKKGNGGGNQKRSDSKKNPHDKTKKGGNGDDFASLAPAAAERLRDALNALELHGDESGGKTPPDLSLDGEQPSAALGDVFRAILGASVAVSQALLGALEDDDVAKLRRMREAYPAIAGKLQQAFSRADLGAFSCVGDPDSSAKFYALWCEALVAAGKVCFRLGDDTLVTEIARALTAVLREEPQRAAAGGSTAEEQANASGSEDAGGLESSDNKSGKTGVARWGQEGVPAPEAAAAARAFVALAERQARESLVLGSTSSLRPEFSKRSDFYLDVRMVTTQKNAGRGVFLRSGEAVPRDSVLLLERPLLCVAKPSSNCEVLSCDHCMSVIGRLQPAIAELCMRAEGPLKSARSVLRDVAREMGPNPSVADFVAKTCARSFAPNAVWCSSSNNDPQVCGVLFCSPQCRHEAEAAHSLVCGDEAWHEFDAYSAATTWRAGIAGRILANVAAAALKTDAEETGNPRFEEEDGARHAKRTYHEFAAFCRAPWTSIEQCDPDTHSTESEEHGSAFADMKAEVLDYSLQLLTQTRVAKRLFAAGDDRPEAFLARQMLKAADWSNLIGAIDLNAAMIETSAAAARGPNRPRCSGVALFALHACLNHSCSPNAKAIASSPESSEARVKVIAMRKILPDEQVTISYIDEKLSTPDRQKHLKVSYLFDCTCPKCDTN